MDVDVDVDIKFTEIGKKISGTIRRPLNTGIQLGKPNKDIFK